MQVLSKSSDCADRVITEETAFGKDKISQTRSGLHDLLNTPILKLPAISQIDYPKAIIADSSGEI